MGVFFRFGLSVLAISVALTACKKRNDRTSEVKGVYADPGETYFNSEQKAKALYSYHFDDDRSQDGAICIYVAEFEPGTFVDQEFSNQLFRQAKPLTQNGIDLKNLFDATMGTKESFSALFKFRGRASTVMFEINNSEKLEKTDAGIRTMHKFIELAKSNERKQIAPCPVSHPEANIR